jgi:hydrogenase maturation factor
MRNKYPGICYRCKKFVPKNEGHFQRHKGTWLLQHASCAIEVKEKKESKSSMV